MAVDFSKLLSKPLDDVKKPPPWPAGLYKGTIVKYEFGDNNKNNTPYCRVFGKAIAPGPGLEPDQLEGIDFTKGREFRRDFYLTGEADWRLKEFLVALGINTTGRTFAETVPEMLNLPILIDVVQQNSTQNPEELINFANEFRADNS